MTSWLQGKTVRKGGITSSTSIASSASHSRSSTPHVQSTSTTVFGGGVKDPSGRTSEFFVSIYYLTLLDSSYPLSQVYGRPVSRLQERPLFKSEASSVG
jgi:hypothetical protein